MNRYPKAKWVPWKPTSPDGQPTYWKGVCKPEAVVLHIMAGYADTALNWAQVGHYGASWHFTVGRNGSVMQHLELNDAGYHAGIPSSAPAPTWPLWRGVNENVNWYTIGIEHEGFPGASFTDAQAEASRELCRWLSQTLTIPLDREHFPPHADIDVVNRVNDFNTPALREEFYSFLLEDEMTTGERALLYAIKEVLVGHNNPDGDKLIADWNNNGNALLTGYGIEQQKLAEVTGMVIEHVGSHPAEGAVPAHTHSLSWVEPTIGEPVQ